MLFRNRNVNIIILNKGAKPIDILLLHERHTVRHRAIQSRQEGIIRTMKEIHGSYYFLRKNISALSFAEFRDFKGFLR